ncbi:MAG: prepilin peptidase [Spirochaetia bacterium]
MNRWIDLLLFALFAVPITLIDVREYRIPDVLTLGGTAAFVVLRLLTGNQSLLELAGELGVGFGVFWLIWRSTGGKIGLGDAKFSGFIAVATGFPGWFASLFLASLLGFLSAVVLVAICRVDRKVAIPFAPFLAAGALIDLLFGSFLGMMPEFEM